MTDDCAQPISVVLIPGDGIGPEVAEATREVFRAAAAPIAWHEASAGLSAVQAHGTPLPDDTLAAIASCRVALKGPCQTPVGSGFRSVNVALRKHFDLYASLRPVRSLPGVRSRYEGVDLVVVRENTEGLYAGIENEVAPGVVTSIKVATERACRRIARWALDYALRKGRRQVTVFHKANIMKLTDGLFLSCAEDEKKSSDRYAPLAWDQRIIDAGCMQLVQDPSRFDVLLLENLYGDVISDLCAGLVGGLGVVPGANFGDGHAIFEAVHGSAPDIAGKGVANPLALILSGVMLLRYLADQVEKLSPDACAQCERSAGSIEAACFDCLREGRYTYDLGGKLGTQGFVEALCKRIDA